MLDGLHIVSLEDADNVQLVGGKAINLAALLRAGFPVPTGFVVTTHGFHAHRFSPAEIEAEIRAAYEALARVHGAGADAWPAVAVRSSATAEDMAGASMAGQYETFLDIRGADDVLEAVKKCWASISTPRTQAYLRQHNIDPANVAMAVIVQLLIPAEIAGVMFTVNPRTANEGEILIEASWGLGETVVSGVVQPDTVVLDKTNGAVKTYLVGTKEIRIVPGNHEHQATTAEERAARCLDAEQLAKLHGLALQAHAHFDGPQDTEWAIAGGELFLLQSRAVTTLAAARAAANLLDDSRRMLRAWKQAGKGDWARHNLGETVPHPTPLTWSVLQRFMTPAGGFGKMYELAGYEPSKKLNPGGFLDLIGGRIYMDLSLAPEMFFEHFPFRYDTDLLRTTPSAAQAAPTLPAGSPAAQFRMGRRLNRAAKHLAAIAETFDRTLDERIIPQFRQWVSAEGQRDLTALSPEAWIETWQQREARVMDDFAPRALLPSLICGMALENLRAFLAPHLAEEDPEELANLLAAGGPPDATLRSNRALYRVATGELALEKWLEEYGHRAPEELDLTTPRWRERPEAVVGLARHLVNGADPQTEHERRTAQAKTRLAEIKRDLSRSEQKQLETHVALCHRYLRFREDAKHELMRGYELLRQMVCDAAQRLSLPPGDVCLLNFEELAMLVRDPAAAAVTRSEKLAAIRTRRTAEARLSLPDVITAEDIDTLGELRLPAHADRLDAFSISTGTASGPVRIVHSPETAADLGSGYILVCRSTDPSWTPLFVNAAGIVLECGGSLSHGAVVAREMGKPAVVLPNAIQLLTENQQVAVDGDRGAVLLTAGAEAGAHAAAISPGDTRIPWPQLPPPPGRREKNAAHLRNVTGIFWLLFLALVFLVPRTHLRELSLEVLDKILWPVFRAWGGLATVAVIAGAIAVLTMIGQLILTDTPRLREAKRRAAALKKQAGEFPPASPRKKALLAAAAPAQSRLTMAAFVPLAVLLGPMVMSFVWLPERIDRASANPRPGATAIVTADVDADYVGPVTLTVNSPPSHLHEPGPPTPITPTQHAAAIRPVLQQLAAKLDDNTLPPIVAARLEETGKSRAALKADLAHFLAAPLPPQTLTWTLPTPENTTGEIYNFSVATPHDAIAAALILGNIQPPPLNISTDEKGNRIETVPASDASSTAPLKALKIRYTDSRRADPAPFFAPFAKLGWHYDFNWLGAYLLFYIVALFAARRLLRIP